MSRLALLNEGMNRQLAIDYIPDNASYLSCSIGGIHIQFQQRPMFLHLYIFYNRILYYLLKLCSNIY